MEVGAFVEPMEVIAGEEREIVGDGVMLFAHWVVRGLD
jgi:hypothetical protein